MRPSTVSIELRLYGQLREMAAASEGPRTLREGGSVADLMALLRGEGVIPEVLLSVSAVAVNQEYANPRQLLRDGDVVAILPPVSGGCA
jgi:molybdopterin converting factor small subunit